MNSLQQLLNQLTDNVETLEFASVISVIEQYYQFTPTAFRNGELHNEANQNNGSCKVFAFALLHNLSEDQALALFAEHYRAVLANVDGDDHQNIRNFMKYGWSGVAFERPSLKQLDSVE